MSKSSGALCWQLVTHLSEVHIVSILRVERSNIDMLNTLDVCRRILLRILTLTFSIAVCYLASAVKFGEISVAFPTKFTFCIISRYTWNRLTASCRSVFATAAVNNVECTL